jgi:hypothetical protein
VPESKRGVDSLIVTEIIDLTRNRAISDAVVVTGDEDLRIAFQVAQAFGVRVHVLAAGDPTKNVSPSLQMESDSVSALDGVWFTSHFELIAHTATSSPPGAPVISPSKAPQAPHAITIEAALTAVIGEMLSIIKPDQLVQLVTHVTTHKTVPPEYDRPLIAKVSTALSGQRLTSDEMRRIRGQFITAIKTTKGQ